MWLNFSLPAFHIYILIYVEKYFTLLHKIHFLYVVAPKSENIQERVDFVSQ